MQGLGHTMKKIIKNNVESYCESIRKDTSPPIGPELIRGYFFPPGKLQVTRYMHEFIPDTYNIHIGAICYKPYICTCLIPTLNYMMIHSGSCTQIFFVEL